MSRQGRQYIRVVREPCELCLDPWVCFAAQHNSKFLTWLHSPLVASISCVTLLAATWTVTQLGPADSKSSCQPH